MSTVLVTGANGLLATNTIIELVKNDFFVKALVRKREKFILNHLKNIELIEGDLTDYTSLESATRNCDYIVHTAAETRQRLLNYKDYSKVNYTGTDYLFKAAIRNGVKKIIHVSTCNVFGYGSKLNPGDENKKISKPFSHSLYVKSKVRSQHLALSFSDKIEVVVVNPTFMIGAYDQKPSSGRIILFGLNKKIILVPPGGKNFVDVKDAAKGIVNAIYNGKNKESYILSGDNLSYREFFSKLNLLSNKKPLLISIPCFALFFMGIIGDFLKIFNLRNEFTLTNMKILCVKNYYTNNKAKTDLSIDFNPIDNAINDAILWFSKKNKIRKSG